MTHPRGIRRPRRKRYVKSGELDTQAVKRVTITSVAPPNLEPTQTYQATVLVEGFTATEEGGTFFEKTDETPRWISTNPAIFTVHASGGLVTGVAVGSAFLIVDVDGHRDTQMVTITNPQSAVATVEIVEGNGQINLTAGTNATRQARAKDASGNVLLGKVITWSELTGTSFITVGADSGDETHQVNIAADSAGTATFKASCEGIDSATLTVVVTASSSAHPNEPAGYTQLVNFDCSNLTGWANLNNFENVAIVSDGTAPASPSDVVELEWPVGTQTGGVPLRDFVFSPRLRELYVSYWFKANSPYTKHPSATEKILLIGTNGPEPGSSSKRNEIVVAWHGGSPASSRILLDIQVPDQTSPDGMTTNAYFASNINGATNLVPTNAWHHVEVVCKANTPGVKDGTLRWWIDGVEIGLHDQLWFNTTLRGEFTAIRFQWYRGGTGAITFSTAEHVYQDHLYASGIVY